VPYEGELRGDLLEWMVRWQERSDLCLALGTSLSGFNVDQVAEVARQKFAQGLSKGLVIVNLQQTPYDYGCTLRIFAKIDKVLELLASALQITHLVRSNDYMYVPDVPVAACLTEDVVLVPFDEHGEPSLNGGTMVWDLRVGRRVRLTGGPYKGDVGTVKEKSADGHYRIRFEESIHPCFNVKRRPFSLWLGSWWLQQATHGIGIVPGGRIPLVNVETTAVTAIKTEMPTHAPLEV